MAQRDIERVIAAHAPRLMALPGVVGLAEGRLPDGRTCVRVYVVRPADATGAGLPPELDGFPVDVEVSGELRPLDGER